MSPSGPVLLIGGTGQVGWELQRALAPLGPLVTPGRADLDLARTETIDRAVRRIRPKLIVNAAAYTAVDRAESEPELAAIINTEAPRSLADAARALEIPLVHYSTDYVFSGDKATPYVESDETAPRSVYGRTKLDGERAIAASGVQGLVFRTSWVFGEVGGNFVRTILRLAGEKDALRVVRDQIGSPTPAALIADVTAYAVHTLERDGWPRGAEMYHLTAAHAVSWHAFAQAIVAKARDLGMSLKLAPDAIEAIASEQYPTAAERPKNSRLDCSALEQRFGLELPGWEPYLERMLMRYSRA